MSALEKDVEQSEGQGRDYYYSPEFKAKALVLLRESGFNYRETAASLGVDRSTLWRWHNTGQGLSPAAVQRAQELNSRLEAVWRERTHAALENMTDEKLEKASAKDCAIIGGIGTEKVQLLSGQPTQVTEHRHEVKGLFVHLVEKYERDPGEAVTIISEQLNIPVEEVKRLCE